jgi:hypothetical protein
VRPAVYASSILSRTHAYLTYTLFYPRDWIPIVCVPYACHDNDLEVVMLTVERSAGHDPGALVYVESKFHSKFVAEPGSKLARSRDGRPLVAIESEGHGMTPILTTEPVERANVVHLHVDSSAPLGPKGRVQSYALLSLYETLWRRRSPAAANGTLWTDGDLGWLSYAGVRFGRAGLPLGANLAVREYKGGVHPPWGIDPNQNRGDWFFDPAFGALSRHARYFGSSQPSLDYELNPYVEELLGECAHQHCPTGMGDATRASLPATFPLTAVGLLLLGWRRRPRD